LSLLTSSPTGFGVDFVGKRTGHAKDAVGPVDDGAVFVFRNVAVDVELLEFGLLFGEKIVVFSEAKSFAVETSQSVEKANVIERIWLELSLLQDAEDFGESDLNEGFLEFGAVGKLVHFGA
jgi:hypothetical protein